MVEEPVQHALSRIEAAILRIETLARMAAPIPDPELISMTARHDRLRAQTGDVLARLDRLIERAAAG